MATNQTIEEQKTCGTCQFFVPDEQSRDWGICQLKELWTATPQLTKIDMHACYQAFQKSSWQPIRIGKASTRPAWATAGLYISIGLTTIFLILAIVFLLIPPFTIEDIFCLLPIVLLGIIAIIFFWRAH
jgi:hypothetical protein